MSALRRPLGDVPESEAKPLLDAYGVVLNKLNLVDRDDPTTLMIGKSVINAAQLVGSDPIAIVKEVLREVGPRYRLFLLR